MNGFPKRASNGSRTSGKAAAAMDLPTAIKMLPLVERVVADLKTTATQLEPLKWERDRLESHRRDLLWPERARRYQLAEDIKTLDARRKALKHELSELGVAIVDPRAGRVGFPTIVNGKPAHFSWQPGELSIDFWHFRADTTRRRPIPGTWSKAAAVPAPAAKGRKASKAREN